MARWCTKRFRYALYRRDNFTCAWCGCTVVPGANTTNPCAATLDHLKPRSKGGALRDPKNLVTACARCNSLRRDLRARAFKSLLVEREIVEPAAKPEITKEIRRRKRRKLRYAA